MEVLRYLAKANRFSRSAGAITAYLGITKGTVSQTLNTLESRGLISKQVDPSDRRSKRLALTARGKSLLKRDPLRSTISTIGRLGDAECRSFEKTLGSFLSNRLNAQGRKPFGQCQSCRFFASHHSAGAPHYCRLLMEKLSNADSLSICFEQQPV